MDGSLDPVTLFLLSIAAIFLIGALGEVIFQRTNIPDVIWLIVAGILLGPVLGIVTREILASIAPYFAALTLVVVLFQGGTTLNLNELSRAAPRSSVLALLSFSLSAAALCVASMGAAAVGWLPDSWTWAHGLLLGTILGGSSSIIIMPAMAQARLPAKLANLVNLESALTDAFCVVGTSAIIDVMVGGAGGASQNPGVTLLRSFGIGLAIGVAAGLIWLLFLRFLHSNEHAYPLTLSALLVLYVVIDNSGGSAALGILAVAIMLGNAPLLGKMIGLRDSVSLDTGVQGFHGQMAFFVKSFFFVFIGAMLGPPWGQLLLGVLLGGLLLGARLPAVKLASLGSDFSRPEEKMITVSMPRGMAAGVLATLPLARGVEGTADLPVLVFACVFTTILVFAVGFPIVKAKLPRGASAADASSMALPAGAAVPSVRPPSDAALASGATPLESGASSDAERPASPPIEVPAANAGVRDSGPPAAARDN